MTHDPPVPVAAPFWRRWLTWLAAYEAAEDEARDASDARLGALEQAVAALTARGAGPSAAPRRAES